MKKLLLLIFILITGYNFSQVQNVTFTISPASFNENDQITITVSNVNPGSWGATDIYLWAWSFDLNNANSIDSPTNGTWTNSNEAQKLTNNGNGTYSILLTPSSFYSRTGIGRMGMLVKAKNGDGDKKSQDFLVDLETNQLSLTSPIVDPIIVDSGTLITISATTTFTSNFSLWANGIVVNTANADTDFVLEVNDGNQVLSEIFTARLTPSSPVPNGMLDGINFDPNDNTKATLVLYAPGKSTVHLIGNFNNWQTVNNYKMNKDTALDKFWIELTGLTPQFNQQHIQVYPHIQREIQIMQ